MRSIGRGTRTHETETTHARFRETTEGDSKKWIMRERIGAREIEIDRERERVRERERERERERREETERQN